MQGLAESPRYLISACLCGISCRYDGSSATVAELAELYRRGTAIAVCPEVEGGLSVPRPPCELRLGRVFDPTGRELTEEFELGAQKTFELAKQHNIRIAILKESSPSCGSTLIYDGSFSRRRIAGLGVTAAFLKAAGIMVTNELDYRKVILGS